MAKFALEFCLKQNRHEFLIYLGKRYTRPDKASDWTKGVSKLERKWSKRLKQLALSEGISRKAGKAEAVFLRPLSRGKIHVGKMQAGEGE